MNVKKAIKRIAAIGTGATLMGATVLGAMAADLANYPAPFVEDGQFNAMLVVGESAQTPDVIGAVDIATSLQYEMRTPAAVSGEAAEGETVRVSGDNVRIDEQFNRLEFDEYLYDVFDMLTDEDLDVLADSELAGETYTQTIEFAETNGKVRYLEEGRDFNEDTPGWYLEFDSGLIFTYRMELGAGVDLEDLKDEEFEMLGMTYTVDSVDDTTEGEEVITLLGAAVQETLLEGETGTYMLDGKEYEVEVAYGYDGSARFVVNGESTDTLDLDDSYELDDGTRIRFVRELKQRGDEPSYIEFHLGSDELELKDGNVLRNDERYDNVVVGLDIDDGVLLGLHLDVFADDERYDISAGSSLAAYFEQTDDHIPGDFDLHFLGVTEPMTTTFDVEHDDEQLELELDTGAGVYTLPLAWNEDDTSTGWIGTEENALWLYHPHGEDGVEWNPEVGEGDNLFGDDYGYIYEDDYFVLNTDTDPEDTTSRVFRLRDIDFDDNRYVIEIRDMEGSTREVSLRWDADDGAYTGRVRIGGQSHRFIVAAGDEDEDADAVAIDEVYNNGVVSLASGTYLDFDDITFAEITDDSLEGHPRDVPVGDVNDGYTMTHVVPSRMLDGSGSEEWDFTVTIGGNEDDVDFDPTGAPPTPLASDGGVDVDDDTVWYSVFGVRVWEDDDGEEWSVRVPYSQVLPQVYATSGDVSVSERHDEATGDAYDIAPVQAGIAVLDTEVGNWQDENVIVVGGPCVSTVAAEMLGNPDECTEGFEPGVGRILVQEHGANVAMLVAGYAADETRQAAAVVNNHRDYDFEGTELEVSGTNMANLDVVSVE